MANRQRAKFAIAIGALIALGLLPLHGCDRKPAGPASGAVATTTYTVRGAIVELPDPANPRTSFRVRHEAIDDFKSVEGKVVGMNSMTMEFRADTAMLKGLAQGDKIEMTFETWPAGEAPMRYLDNRVKSVRKLLADTALEFREARPAGG